MYTDLDNGHPLLPTLFNECFFVYLLAVKILQTAIGQAVSGRGRSTARNSYTYSHFFLRGLLVHLHSLGEAALELVFVAAVSPPPVPAARQRAPVLPQPPISVPFH